MKNAEVSSELGIMDEIRRLKSQIRRLENENNIPLENPGLQFGCGNEEDEGMALFMEMVREKDFLKIVAMNPYCSDSDEINFYNTYSLVTYKTPELRRAHDPFTWISLMRSDLILSSVFDYLMDKAMTQPVERRTLDKSLKSVEVKFMAKTENGEGLQDIKPLLQTLSERFNPILLGHSFYTGDLSQARQLADKVLMVLPTRKVIWKLVLRFFAQLYICFPVIDQKDFTEEICKAIGPILYVDEKVESIRVVRRMDFAYLGVLLVMLRLTYLSLISNSYHVNRANFSICLPNDPDLYFLLNNPVSVDLGAIADKCLLQFNLFNVTSIKVVQLLCFLKIYHTFAPEEGDGDREHLAAFTNNVIVSACKSVGLNRDPDSFGDATMEPRHKHLHRKIWWAVYCTSVYYSLYSGSHISVRQTDFDVKIPEYEPGLDNVYDPSIEKSACSFFRYKYDYFGFIHKFSEYALQTNVQLSVRELTNRLGQFEQAFLCTDVGKMENYFKNPDLTPFDKSIGTKRHLLASALLLSVMLHLYNFYEPQRKAALLFFYMRKMVILITFDMIPLCFEIFERGHVFFTTDLVIMPDLLMALHKATLILLSFYLRFRIAVRRNLSHFEHSKRMIVDETYAGVHKSMKNIGHLFELHAKVLIQTLHRFSPRYYYAWRLNKSLSTIFEIVTSEEFTHNELFVNGYGVLTCPGNLSQLEDMLTKSYSKIIASRERLEEVQVAHPEHVDDVYNDSQIDQFWKQVLSTRTDETAPRFYAQEDQGETPNVGNSQAPFVDNGGIQLLEGLSIDDLLRSFFENS